MLVKPARRKSLHECLKLEIGSPKTPSNHNQSHVQWPQKLWALHACCGDPSLPRRRRRSTGPMSSRKASSARTKETWLLRLHDMLQHVPTGRAFWHLFSVLKLASKEWKDQPWQQELLWNFHLYPAEATWHLHMPSYLSHALTWLRLPCALSDVFEFQSKPAGLRTKQIGLVKSIAW